MTDVPLINVICHGMENKLVVYFIILQGCHGQGKVSGK